MAAGSFDTIVAVSSPPGPGARGIVRLSGAQALTLANGLLAPGAAPVTARGLWPRPLQLLGSAVDGLVLFLPGPRSATGEDQTELHLPGAPVLLAATVRALLAAGARAALPGEFTRRAFECGRLSLDEAAAVCDLIHAGSAAAARRAAAVLDAGLGRVLDTLRGDLVEVLAWIESGLDFEDHETGAVAADRWLPCLQAALARARELAATPAPAAAAVVVLSGDANAGKSTLFNALLGRPCALVAPIPGTTRDVLREPLVVGERTLLLCDLPGRRAPADQDAIDARGQVLAARQRDQAELVLHVHDGTRPLLPQQVTPGAAAVVVTKADLLAAPLPALAVPVVRVAAPHGTGLTELRAFLASHAAPPSLLAVRTAAAGDALVAALARAVALAADAAPTELVAVELRDALVALETLHGRGDDDAVLDRIFARFCLGK